MPHPRLPHDRLIALYVMLAGAPGVVATALLLHHADASSKTAGTVLLVVAGAWLAFAAAAHNRVVRTLQTIANLLSALREGDFSVRGRGAGHDDPLGEVMTEINTLSQTLNEQRLSAMEATALLRTIMAEIDVAIFAFDERDVLRLANPAGQRLLHTPADRLIGRPAADIGLAELLEGDDGRVLETARFAGAQARARWSLRRSRFRERGVPHTLVVVADVSQALREEEIKAWQRLVRVLGHELNNSLAPIKSIAGSLGSHLERPAAARAADWEEDMRSGLGIIAARADSLTRFMQAYARLTRLPPPALAPADIGQLVRRTASLEVRLAVHVASGPRMHVPIDAAQIEQVLINLIANATEAALEAREAGHADAGVQLTWQRLPGALEITITDDGPGIANTSNLFVPFFTTKQKGTGIGLVLCRQIAENHGGSVALESRTDGHSGCIARLRLPL